MTGNPVKRALLEGSVSIGTLVIEFDSTGIARIARSAGAEFILFDMQHTGWSLQRIRTLIASTRGTDIVPIVRVPTIDWHFIGSVLDLGALGVMAPSLDDAEEGRALVRAAKFPPSGERHFGTIYRDALSPTLNESMRRFDEDVLVIGQIETASGIENVDAIAAVEGLDVLWLGTYDLSISLGLAEDLEHPRYVEAVDRMLTACERHNKVPGVLVEHLDEARAALARGFRCLMYSFDAALYEEALGQGIAGIRAAHVR